MNQPSVLISCDIDPTGRSRPHHFCYQDYVTALNSVGLNAVLLPIQSKDVLCDLLSQSSGLLIPGGDDLICPDKLSEEVFVEEQRQASDTDMVNIALELNLPILAVCYGMQLVNQVMGGSHHRHMANAQQHMDGKLHGLQRTEDLPYIPESPWMQASFHHQSIDQLAEGLNCIIRSDDDEIEAISSFNNKSILGTQWHVEKCETLADTSLLREFSRRIVDDKT